jgi:AraC family transcriptional regulator
MCNRYMQNIKTTISFCIEYVENNINKKFTLDDISRNTNISKFHLHRMFKTLTGETIMEYSQSRKLTCSIDDLINTNKRIIDIALDYGFDYEQSYIRAFRKKFGITPMKIRSEHISLRITEKINIHDIQNVDNSYIYKPHFEFKQKFYLIGIKHKLMSKSGDKTANTYGKSFFYNQKNDIHDIINPHIYFGYTDWSKNNNGFIYYIPSVMVKNLNQIPENMTGTFVPANKYVVFKFIGYFRPDEISSRNVGRLLVQLYNRWIFKSGYEFADTFRFEYIDTSISKDNYCELYIYQPIREKENKSICIGNY